MLTHHYRQTDLIRVSYSANTTTLETRLPYFSPELLAEIAAVLGEDRVQASTFVWLGCNGRQGTFHHGGDLGLMADADEEGITEYGQQCARLVEMVLKHPRTVAVVQGECYGGGLEGALACRTVTFMPGSQLWFPEYAFGAFPGMGGRLFGDELRAAGYGRLNSGASMAGPLHLNRTAYIHPVRIFEETYLWVSAMMQVKSDPAGHRQIKARARLQRRLARNIKW